MEARASRPQKGPCAAIIDMDDTLYPERQYLLSGVGAVARFLAPRVDRAHGEIEQMLESLLAEPAGREKLFGRLLRRLEMPSASLELALVHAYRTHLPSLRPCADVLPALDRIRAAGLRLALVTDGPATVQRNKFAALGLASRFDAVVFTDDLPPGNRKPAVAPFELAAMLLGVHPEQCACIADDASKDFFAPRQLGMITVCVRRKLQHPLQPSTDFPPDYLAHHVVDELGAAARVVLSSFQEEK